MSKPSDLDIARAAKPRPMADIAADLGLDLAELIPFGHDKAKLARSVTDRAAASRGKLILVTAINPTPAGEGKTTTTVGLGDGLRRLGKRAAICLREPSLGPCFGMKGGAAGGGQAQIIPMEDLNLHFTGDFHAITAAHNLLAAMIDNHLHWGNGLGIDPRRVVWRRVVDMNDRALRQITLGLGGPAHGVPREGGFDITVASEVMAALCLARDLEDLQARLARMVVAERADGSPVTCAELQADGAMAVLLCDAMQPNLVQSLDGTPALVHGGPFANIAHGCNSRVATETALGLADYVVTEAGFGADLGAEKFFNIKCHQTGLAPDAVVLVATVRALKYAGGVARSDLDRPDVDAVIRGCAALARHIENLQRFGPPVAVAVNRFDGDSPSELAAVMDHAAAAGVRAEICTHWADGAAGIAPLAAHVADLCAGPGAPLRLSYGAELPLFDKIETVARDIYRAGRVVASDRLRTRLDRWQAAGHGALPVCMAKTPYSFSADPDLRGVPCGFDMPLADLRLSAGAGFVVAIFGDLMTMPGLPRHPAAERIGLDAQGRIDGLF